MRRLALALGIAAIPAFASAETLETTHLFGFTLGSDVNDVGEKEAESESTGRFGKVSGRYAAVSEALGVKFVPFQDFSVEPVLSAAYHSISQVPGLDNRGQLAFESASVELRYRLVNREQSGFGMTVGIDPHWGRVDDISGEPVNQYGSAFLAVVDKELVHEKLFAAFNFIYEPNAIQSRISGEWQHESSLALSGAMAFQVSSGILIGGEARYMGSYDGMGLDMRRGQAFFLGPTFYSRFSERAWMSAAWSAQISGAATGQDRTLDLTNFERHRAVLRFGYNF